MKSKGIYWAYIIVGAIALNICAAIYTVVLSTDYPLDYDESYFAPYQQVENDFINIQAAQEEFNKRFKVRTRGGVRTHLAITHRPALLLKSGDNIYIDIMGEGANKLYVDARIKQPQDITPARKIAPKRGEQNGVAWLEFSAGELKPGRNTLMIDLSSEPKGASDAHIKAQTKHDEHSPRRFLRLELCLNQCSANDIAG